MRTAAHLGTFLILYALAFVIWVPLQRKWPRVALVLFMLATVEFLYTGVAQLVHTLVNLAAGLLAKGINMALGFLFSIANHAAPSTHATRLGVVVVAGTIIAGVAVICLGYVVAHLGPDKLSSANVAEHTFVAAFIFIALAGMITGAVGTGILQLLSSLASGLGAPLASMFGA